MVKRKKEKTHKRLELQEFINQVKREILETQTANEGDAALFELEKIELEVKVATTYSAEGKGRIAFWVLDLGDVGGSYGRENCHTVKLSLKVLKSPPEAQPQKPKLPSKKKDEDDYVLLEDMLVDTKTGAITLGKCTYTSRPKVGPGTPYLIPPDSAASIEVQRIVDEMMRQIE